jgi:DDE superfamily endonuclease
MACLTRHDLAALEPSTTIRCRCDRADVADDASRCDALVDPLDGCGNWLFPHHDPPNVGGVRPAAAPQPDIRAIENPLFVDKVRDIVGLYLSPPNRALVLSIDEKSQIQALDREQPVLPMMPGIPERRTHSYVRHGRTTLFAALDVASGFVIGKCYQRHRAVEFLKLLKEIDAQVPEGLDVHIVMDNYATHKTDAVWNDRLGSALIQFLAQFGAVVSLVAEHTLRRLYPADQALCDRAVVCFTSGQQNGDQAPLSICECVYLRVALRASGQQPASDRRPPLPPLRKSRASDFVQS